MRNKTSLCKEWRFAKGAENFDPARPISGAAVETVTVPHCWNAADGACGGEYYRGTGIYQTAIRVPQDAGACHFLEFEGASSVCRVYLNGTQLGEHRGGYSTFRFEITGLCTPGGEDLLTVVVDNSPSQDVEPATGDFTVFGGLYRPVWLISTPAAHFDLLYHGTAGVLLTPTLAENGQGLLKIEPHTAGAENARMSCEIIDPAGKPVAAVTDVQPKPLTMSVEHPTLWNGRANPALYTFTARLTDGGMTDEVRMTFGFRSFHVDPNSGFSLNGTAMPLHGAARHQDREGCGYAVSEADLAEDMAILRELGANTVRLSHYQHAQYFYDLCDREGLVVWAEIPMLAMDPANKAQFANACDQLTELILQNQHHPSICFWGLQNEIAVEGESLAMYSEMEELQALAKQLDPTRLTTSANLYCVRDNSPLNQITDVVAYNIYYGWYYGEVEEYGEFFDRFHAENPDVCLGVSEYGVDANPAFHSDTPKRKDYSEEYQCAFHEAAYSAMAKRPFVWGTYVWNLFDFGSALRDEGGTKGKNCKGLVSYDRKTRKDAFYYYKAQWSDEPFVHLNGRRYRDRAAEEITVRVYSNAKEVALTVNGEAFQTKSGDKVFVFEHVPLKMGENTVTAAAGEVADTVIWNRTEQPNPAYTYVDPNPGYNVKNWFTLGQSEEDLFPADRYSLMDTMGDLLANPQTAELIRQACPALWDDPRLLGAKSFTLFKLVNRLSGSFPEDTVKELNRKLGEIAKPAAQ